MQFTAESVNGTRLTVVMEGEGITLVRDTSNTHMENPFTVGVPEKLYGDSVLFKRGKIHLYDADRWVYSSGRLVA